MKISDFDAFVKLDLTFKPEAEPPEEDENAYYLVLGILEAANGWIGPHFVVCGRMDGRWYVAPDGPELSDGLPMWDGSSGTSHCSFDPVKWALLPEGEE